MSFKMLQAPVKKETPASKRKRLRVIFVNQEEIMAQLNVPEYGSMTAKQIFADVISKLGYQRFDQEEIDLLHELIAKKYGSRVTEHVRRLILELQSILKYLCTHQGLVYIKDSLKYNSSEVVFACYRGDHKKTKYEKFADHLLIGPQMIVCGDKRTVIFKGILALNEVHATYVMLRRRGLIARV